MKLKYQLLLLGILSLLLPITGWFALKSVDVEFRNSIEQASRNTLRSLKASVRQMLKKNTDFSLKGLVLGNIDELELDGDDNEWLAIKAYTYHNKENTTEVKLAQVNNKFSVFIFSNDKSKDFNDFSENDYVILGLANERGLYKYIIPRQAEGKVQLQQTSATQPYYQAYWHERADGYSLEIQFSNNDFHHFGMASVDITKHLKHITGNLQSENDLKLIQIIANNKEFQQSINDITPPNNAFSLLDSQNRTIYQSNKLPKNQKVSAWQWLITPMYQWLFAIDDSSNWFYRQSDGMAGIFQSISDDDVEYQLKSMMPQGQQNMIQTLLKASVSMIVVVFLIMLAYLIYAAILAWRIRNLNNALQLVLDDSGKLHTLMPSHSAKDEIGQLSRGIESMLSELGEYTHYLKDLGKRLSHEMKTPLAIVQTSLDNIEASNNTEFLQRAKDGTNRLKFILNQLSELSQLKYTLENTPKQPFNLTKLCQQLGQSYQSYIPNLEVELPSEKFIINGCADLIAQMIDKLMENAKDFTPRDGVIKFLLSYENNKAKIVLRNTGPHIPLEKQKEIFSSLVSLRKRNHQNTNHMGLGLYIVQLIVKYHGGNITVNNLINPESVEFTVTIVHKKV